MVLEVVGLIIVRCKEVLYVNVVLCCGDFCWSFMLGLILDCDMYFKIVF